MADDDKLLEKSYETLKKKYSLPSFEELDKEFEIHCIEENIFVTREIRHRITEKVDELCMMLEDVLQPDTKVSNLYESRIFAESDKEQLFIIFKKLMTIKKKSALLLLLNSEKEDAEFIKNAFAQWPELKTQLEPFFRKLIESWETSADVKEQLSYFG